MIYIAAMGLSIQVLAESTYFMLAYAYLVPVVVRPRTHGVKKVPESHKFESNLAQNPQFLFKFVDQGHFFYFMCTSPNGRNDNLR